MSLHGFQSQNPGQHVFTAKSRILAQDYPCSQQAEFAKLYPHGVPMQYTMILRKSHAPPQEYLENNLPRGFYINPPANARCLFSTEGGNKPARSLEHFLPQRQIHLWSKDEVQTQCNSLRKRHWQHMKAMIKPQSWDDLWMYFDAFDLYRYGVQNLWNVVNHLCVENQIISQDVERENAHHIGYWADEWMEKEDNKKKLKDWTERKESIVFILTDKDRKSLGDVPDDCIPQIASALRTRRAWLIAGDAAFRKGRTEASDIMTACRNHTFHNWLGTALPLDSPFSLTGEANRCEQWARKCLAETDCRRRLPLSHWPRPTSRHLCMSTRRDVTTFSQKAWASQSAVTPASRSVPLKH